MCQNFIYAALFKIWPYIIIIFLCCDTSLLEINCFHTSLLPIVSYYVSSFVSFFFFTCLSVPCAVWVNPFSSDCRYFLAISLILPPLSPETVSKAPLSPRVSGVEGQTNTLSDPPLHEGHGDAIYLGSGRRLG